MLMAVTNTHVCAIVVELDHTASRWWVVMCIVYLLGETKLNKSGCNYPNVLLFGMLYDNIFKKHHTPKKVEWSNNATVLTQISVHIFRRFGRLMKIMRPQKWPKTYIHTYIHTYIQTDRQTDIHTYRQTNILTNQGKRPKDFGSLITLAHINILNSDNYSSVS
jgi:hypothetical protein